MPLNSIEWGSWDIGINNKRYEMAVWMINTEWFKGKSKTDIILNLPERKPYTINDSIKIFVVKETEGWNIDNISKPQAYLYIYFDCNDIVTKVRLIERKQSFDEIICKS